MQMCLLKLAQQIWRCSVEWFELSSVRKCNEIELLLTYVTAVQSYGGTKPHS